MNTPNSAGMIKLTTPEGVIYILGSSIIAIAEAWVTGKNDTKVRSKVWVSGQADEFNILEDTETVLERLVTMNRSKQWGRQE